MNLDTASLLDLRESAMSSLASVVSKSTSSSLGWVKNYENCTIINCESLDAYFSKLLKDCKYYHINPVDKNANNDFSDADAIVNKVYKPNECFIKLISVTKHADSTFKGKYTHANYIIFPIVNNKMVIDAIIFETSIALCLHDYIYSRLLQKK